MVHGKGKRRKRRHQRKSVRGPPPLKKAPAPCGQIRPAVPGREKHARGPRRRRPPPPPPRAGKKTAARKALKSRRDRSAPQFPLSIRRWPPKTRARLVANRDIIEESKEGGQTESSSFKQLKERFEQAAFAGAGRVPSEHRAAQEN